LTYFTSYFGQKYGHTTVHIDADGTGAWNIPLCGDGWKLWGFLDDVTVDHIEEQHGMHSSHYIHFRWCNTEKFIDIIIDDVPSDRPHMTIDWLLLHGYIPTFIAQERFTVVIPPPKYAHVVQNMVCVHTPSISYTQLPRTIIPLPLRQTIYFHGW
jgi:hypothetical protein